MKIMIIGNSGAGKTVLSLRLGQAFNIPVTHVDSIQFLSGLSVRPHRESISLLQEIQAQDSWIIEGYGPLDILEKRMDLADVIVMIDFPLWRHFFWSFKRQLKLFITRTQRPELASDSPEYTWKQTRKLFRTIWIQHQKMRPELLRILSREKYQGKVRIVRSVRELRAVRDGGI